MDTSLKKGIQAMKRAISLTLLIVMSGMLAAPSMATQRTIKVDCDHGQSVRKALRRAWPGDTIVVLGTCSESIVIRKDRIVLRGRRGAAFDGATIAPNGSTPPDLVRATAELIPGSRFEVIDNAGHLPCVEQPMEYARLLTEFMRETGYA